MEYRGLNYFENYRVRNDLLASLRQELDCDSFNDKTINADHLIDNE